MEPCGLSDCEATAQFMPDLTARTSRQLGANGGKKTGRTLGVLALAAQQTGSIGIEIKGDPMPQGVLVHYATPADNEPKSFRNQLYAWDTTSNEIPWEKPPIGSTTIASDSSTGTVLLRFDYEQKGYIVGYAVADRPVAVSATVYLPEGSSGNPVEWMYSSTKCQVVYADSNIVQVRYTDLPAYRPNTYRNWVGVWEGSTVPYDGVPLGLAKIDSDSEDGYAVVEALNLSVSTAYCVGYFVVDARAGRTSLAAWTTFSVAPR